MRSTGKLEPILDQNANSGAPDPDVVIDQAFTITVVELQVSLDAFAEREAPVKLIAAAVLVCMRGT